MTKRPVEKYDFKAFGEAIKAARTGRKESRKQVSDEMYISPRYLANIENKGQHSAHCPCRLYRCPKSLEVVFRYWSFFHIYSPYYNLLFPFLLGYIYTVLSVSQSNSYTQLKEKAF